MPLDGHSYLVAQGWTGSGTGLRQGAISRPIAISQKKTLAGVGKDRDEAFPFWDHLFSAASKSIQIKISNDSDDSDSEEPVEAAISLKRTTTGILSNRRPVTGPSAESSGTTTPNSDDVPKLSLLATAKRDAARRMLYAQFFRGPVIGPDAPAPAATHKPTSSDASASEEPREKKRRKLGAEKDEDKAARRERKRLKREKKELKELKRAEKKKRKEEKGQESSVAVVSEKKDEEDEEETVKEKKKKPKSEEHDNSKRKRKRDEEGSEEKRRRKRKATELNNPG